MSGIITVTFRFSGTNIETGRRLVHQETHIMPHGNFSEETFLERINTLFSENLWADRNIEIINKQ